MKILKFYSETCQPCKMVAPIIEQVSDELGYDLQELDIELETELTVKYSVRSVPTVVLVDDSGTELKRAIGYMTKDKLLSDFKVQ